MFEKADDYSGMIATMAKISFALFAIMVISLLLCISNDYSTMYCFIQCFIINTKELNIYVTIYYCRFLSSRTVQDCDTYAIHRDQIARM
jgi:hypothetical protein